MMKSPIVYPGSGSIAIAALLAVLSLTPVRDATAQVQLSSARVLEAVVVTATRLPQPIGETSASISVIDREDIKDRLISDTLDLFREVPGVSVLQSGGRGGTTSLFIRGAENDHTLVLVDGTKMNLGGGSFDFADVLAVNLERVEVLRGPQSALYGADSIAGVVQFITHRGQGPPHLTVSSLAGSDTTFEQTVEFEYGNEQVGLSFGVGRVDTENFLPINQDYRNTTVSLRLDAKPAPEAEFTLTVRHIDVHQEFPTESAGDRFGPLDPDQFADFKRTIAGGRIEIQGKPWWRHLLQLGIFVEDRFSRDAFNPGVDFGSFESDAGERRLSADYTSFITLPMPERFGAILSVGLSAEREEFDQDSLSGFADAAPTPSTVDAERDNKAVYGTFDLNWKKRVFLTAGARFDDNSLFGDELSPRITAAVILPKLKTKLRASYGQGIKAPTFVENFGTGSSFFTGNPTLGAEQSTSFEVGFEQPLLKERLLLTATYFHNEFDDLISFVTGVVSTFENIQKARSRGVEVGLTAELPHGFNVSSSYTFLDTEVLDSGGLGGASFVEGDKLLRRPQNQGSFALHYRSRRFRGVVDTVFIGDADDLDFSAGFPGRRGTLAGYTKTDLALSYEALTDVAHLRSLRLIARVDNLFDENYESPIGFTAPGARYLFGFEAQF